MSRYTMGLLDVLAAKTGCTYLSDLTFPKTKIHILHPLRKIAPSAFTLREWEDAIEYLTGRSAHPSTPQQAKQLLLDYLTELDYPEI